MLILHWLQTSKPLPRFVKNRVQEIHQLTEHRKWRYCPTKDNPADLLTRGIAATDFTGNRLWFQGPSWIVDTGSWPTWDPETTTVCATEVDAEPTDIQPDVSSNVTEGIDKLIKVERYSTLTRLLRVTALVMRFIFNCRSEKSARRLEPVTSSELRDAELMWVRSCQQNAYGDEIRSIKSGTIRTPLVKQLKLFIDDRGNIRSGGRIHNAPYLRPPSSRSYSRRSMHSRVW